MSLETFSTHVPLHGVLVEFDYAVCIVRETSAVLHVFTAFTKLNK